jgi:hypothetical protein
MTQGPLNSAPYLYVRGSSQERIGTDQLHDGGRAYLCKLDGTSYLNTDLTLFLTVTKNLDGSTTFAQTQMTYETTNPITNVPNQTGVWSYTIPYTACPTTAGPWLADVEIHGPAGLGDTLMGHLYANLVERDAPVTP